MKIKKTFPAVMLALIAFIASTNSLYACDDEPGYGDGGPSWSPGYPPPPAPPPPPYNPPAPPGYGNDFVSRQINQYYVGDNYLDLRSLLGLGERYRGRKVEYVTMRARSDFGQAQVWLLVNGATNGYAQTISMWSSDYSFYPQSYGGYGSDNIALQLRGRVTVDSIAVKFAADYGGNPGWPGYSQPITQIVQRNFVGNNSLYLNDFFRLDMYRGMRVRAVTIRASTERGMGQASFCSYSGCSMAQTVATYMSSYSFYSSDMVDNNMRINLQGNFWIDSITIEFQR